MAPTTAKVTSKGQVTIPKAVREELGIRESDQLLFQVEGERIVITPLRSRPLRTLYNALPAARAFPGHDAIRDEIHARLGQRVADGDE